MPRSKTLATWIALIGGAFGLKIMLRNIEASAAGPVAPIPRFLMMHWPVGTLRQQFIPTGTGTGYTTSKTAQGPGYIISPFDTPELRPHTIIIHGLNMNGISSGNGGGHESGTPMATTGANCPGTRDNQGEDDDGAESRAPPELPPNDTELFLDWDQGSPPRAFQRIQRRRGSDFLQ